MSQVSFHNDFQYSYRSSAGRGVIPLEDIPIKTFVCEYKTTGVYTKNIHSKRELEYGLNNESSSCVEVKINGKQKYFDGTRRFNQFGRFINHSTSPNLQLHPPLFVRGKHRIGFFSLHNIPANTELTWDYADRNPEFPWLSEGSYYLQLFLLNILATYPFREAHDNTERRS